MTETTETLAATPIGSGAYGQRLQSGPLMMASAGGQQSGISPSLFVQIITLSDFLLDLFVCVGMFLVSAFLQIHCGILTSSSTPRTVSFAVFAGLVTFGLLRRNRMLFGKELVYETAAAVQAAFQASIFLLPVAVLLRGNLRWWPMLLTSFAIPPVLTIQKKVRLLVIRKLQTKAIRMDRVLIYGAGDSGRHIISKLLSSPIMAPVPVAVVDPDKNRLNDFNEWLTRKTTSNIVALPVQLTASLLQELTCDLLVIDDSTITPDQLESTTEAARDAGVRITYSSQLAWRWNVPMRHTASDDPFLGGDRDLWLQLSRQAKRALDVVLSSFLLILLVPLLCLIALLICLTSKGPVLFVQTRIGQHGRHFKMYKFRSMQAHVLSHDYSPTRFDDPRITSIGRFLRQTGLDELPQLMNVFAGQMSMVGPRPEMPFIVERYTDVERQRLHAVPGITGFWQLSEDRKYPIHENLHHDLEYIGNRNLFLDVAILIHTAFFAIRGGV